MRLATGVGGVEVVVDVRHDTVASELSRLLEAAPCDRLVTHLVRPDPDFGPALGHVWQIGAGGATDPRGFWSATEAAAALWESVEDHLVANARVPLLHAAAVEVAGSAVILVAESRGGKSTLAAVLAAQAGARPLTDELVALDGSRSITALGRPLHVRPESPAPTPEGWERWPAGRHDLLVAPRPSGPDSFPVAGVVFLDRRPQLVSTELVPMTAAASARRLVRASHNVVVLGWSGLTSLVTFAGAVRSWSLRYTEAADVIALITRLGGSPVPTDDEPSAETEGSWRPVLGRAAHVWEFADSALIVSSDRRWVAAVDHEQRARMPASTARRAEPVEVDARILERVDELLGDDHW